MNRLLTIAFAAALLASGLGATQSQAPFASPAASAAPTPTPDPAMTARAKQLFTQLQDGKIDRTQLDSAASSEITDDKVKQAQGVLQPLGAPVTFEQDRVISRQGLTAYYYLVTFGKGQSYEFAMVLDGKGKVAGMQIFPPQ